MVFVHALQLYGNLGNDNKNRIQEIPATIQLIIFYLIFMLKTKYSNIWNFLFAHSFLAIRREER
jgi:hypothetical protein